MSKPENKLQEGIANVVDQQQNDQDNIQPQDSQRDSQEQDKRESILQKIQSFASSLLSTAKDLGKSALSWRKKPKK